MSEPFIGQILTVPYNFPPRGWAFCQGQLLSIAQNTALFSLIGVYYGGNGQTTFALPDLRGRFAMGQGSGPGLSPNVIGEVAGTENVTVLTSNLPLHVHSLAGTTGTLDAVNIKATEQAPQAGAYVSRGVDTAPSPDMVPKFYVPEATGNPATKVPLAGVNVAGNTQIAGSTLPHDTMQPYLVLNQCIALEGIFPSRN